MNKNRENRKKRYINAYVDGNTVKKVYESPLRKESIEKIKNKNIRKAQANSKAMGVTSFLTMFIATAVASFFCIFYGKEYKKNRRDGAKVGKAYK